MKEAGVVAETFDDSERSSSLALEFGRLPSVGVGVDCDACCNYVVELKGSVAAAGVDAFTVCGDTVGL